MPFFCQYFATERFEDKFHDAAIAAIRELSAASSATARHGRKSSERGCPAYVHSLAWSVTRTAQALACVGSALGRASWQMQGQSMWTSSLQETGRASHTGGSCVPLSSDVCSSTFDVGLPTAKIENRVRTILSCLQPVYRLLGDKSLQHDIVSVSQRVL